MANTNQKSTVTGLTQGSVFSNLVRLALPFMLSNLLQMLYSMIEMIEYAGTRLIHFFFLIFSLPPG